MGLIYNRYRIDMAIRTYILLFPNIWRSSCWCPHYKRPTIWGPYWGPSFLELPYRDLRAQGGVAYLDYYGSYGRTPTSWNMTVLQPQAKERRKTIVHDLTSKFQLFGVYLRDEQGPVYAAASKICPECLAPATRFIFSHAQRFHIAT